VFRWTGSLLKHLRWNWWSRLQNKISALSIIIIIITMIIIIIIY